MFVRISKIRVGPLFGPPEIKQVKLLADSISQIGLLNPISIDRGYNLVSGLHRLEAVKLLGWREIECTVINISLLQAALAEVDENSIRKKTNSIEFCNLLLHRKAIYELLHPETRSGGDRKSAAWKDMRSTPAKSFVKDTADKLGVSEATVSRRIRIARNLCADAMEIIRLTHVNIPDKWLLKLVKLGEADQIDAANLFAAGEHDRAITFIQDTLNRQSLESNRDKRGRR